MSRIVDGYVSQFHTGISWDVGVANVGQSAVKSARSIGERETGAIAHYIATVLTVSPDSALDYRGPLRSPAERASHRTTKDLSTRNEQGISAVRSLY